MKLRIGIKLLDRQKLVQALADEIAEGDTEGIASLIDEDLVDRYITSIISNSIEYDDAGVALMDVHVTTN